MKSFEYECTPCKDDSVVREAKHYCPECSEYYCDNCEMSHRRLKATKTHIILHGADMPKTFSQNLAILPVMYCSCNQSRTVDFFCEEHTGVFCSECKGIDHRKCKISTVENASKSFSAESALKATYERAHRLESNTAKLQHKQNEIAEQFKKMEKNCKEEINTKQEKLHAFVDEIADASINELETASQNSTELEGAMVTTANVRQRLQNEQKILQDAMTHECIVQMFVANLKVEMQKYWEVTWWRRKIHWTL